MNRKEAREAMCKGHRIFDTELGSRWYYEMILPTPNKIMQYSTIANSLFERRIGKLEDHNRYTLQLKEKKTFK